MAAATLLPVAASHAAELNCDNKDKLINTSADRDHFCGILNAGDTFHINLLDDILRVVGNEGAFKIMARSMSHRCGHATFADVGVIASGTVDLALGAEKPFSITYTPINLWDNSPVPRQAMR